MEGEVGVCVCKADCMTALESRSGDYKREEGFDGVSNIFIVLLIIIKTKYTGKNNRIHNV